LSCSCTGCRATQQVAEQLNTVLVSPLRKRLGDHVALFPGNVRVEVSFDFIEGTVRVHVGDATQYVKLAVPKGGNPLPFLQTMLRLQLVPTRQAFKAPFVS